MLGGMLAGHDQSGGEVVEHSGKKYKLFYGMSSATAMKKYQGGVKDYRYNLLVVLWPLGNARYCKYIPEPRKGNQWSWNIVEM